MELKVKGNTKAGVYIMQNTIVVRLLGEKMNEGEGETNKKGEGEKEKIESKTGLNVLKSHFFGYKLYKFSKEGGGF